MLFSAEKSEHLQIAPKTQNLDQWACAHYVMVSKFQWKPFWLATQRDPRNDWTATQNGVNYDVFAQAPSDGDVFMHGSYIPRVTTHKHLGVHINSRLSWQDHIDHVYTDCARKIGILRRLQRKLRSRALRKIFIGAIRPRLEYACPVWSRGNTSKLFKLQELCCCRHQIVLPQLQQRLTITHCVVLQDQIELGPSLSDRAFATTLFPLWL